MRTRTKLRLAETVADAALTIAFPPYAVVAVGSAILNVKAARKAAAK